MKIVFFGTSNVALPIIEALSRHHSIVAVVTMPDAKVGRSQTLTESPVSVLAKEMKLNIIKPEKVKGNQEFLSQLQNLCSPSPSPSPQGRGTKKEFPPRGAREEKGGVEMFVVVSYGQILPLEIINLPKHKTINVHFSLLPKYRGPSPIQTAILNGETETGTSIFILDEQVDHGPILAQEKINIDSDDNALTLSEKMAFKSAQLIIPTIDGYISNTINPEPQDDTLATHTKHIDKAHGNIDWNKTAQEIYNQFRAFYPWPGVWTKWEGKLVKIMDCVATELQIGDTTDAYRTGQVLAGGVVACAPVRRSLGEGGANTFLQIKTLQMEGKKETNIKDFLNGYSDFISSQLV